VGHINNTYYLFGGTAGVNSFLEDAGCQEHGQFGKCVAAMSKLRKFQESYAASVYPIRPPALVFDLDSTPQDSL